MSPGKHVPALLAGALSLWRCLDHALLVLIFSFPPPPPPVPLPLPRCLTPGQARARWALRTPRATRTSTWWAPRRWLTTALSKSLIKSCSPLVCDFVLTAVGCSLRLSPRPRPRPRPPPPPRPPPTAPLRGVSVLWPPTLAGILNPDTLFWVEQRGAGRVGFDGWECRAKGSTLLSQNEYKPVGLAVDSDDQIVFWSNDQNAQPKDSWISMVCACCSWPACLACLQACSAAAARHVRACGIREWAVKSPRQCGTGFCVWLPPSRLALLVSARSVVFQLQRRCNPGHPGPV
jgi:hypothetical protein